ncbi:MAG: KUP/HAK/KT family potassium transporter, partial [Verrucomicrobiota bacterium]
MSQPAQEPTQGPAPVKPLTLAATIAALGVVFGDIGTSPLYAFRETFASHHHRPEHQAEHTVDVHRINLDAGHAMMR